MAQAVKQMERLVMQVAGIPDPQSRAAAQALMEAILEIHGEGLARILEMAYDTGEAGQTLIRQIAADNLVGSLLALHALHPDSIETRVKAALGKLQLKTQLLSVTNGIVRVRLPKGGGAWKAKVESAIREAAPDAAGFIVEQDTSADGFVSLESLKSASAKVQ